MTLIFCIDEKGGLAFGKRRQSRDRALTLDAVRLAGGRRLLAAEYSRVLFEEAGLAPDSAVFSEDPVSAAEDGDAVLLELGVSAQDIKRADGLVIYNWNRYYPSTAKIDMRAIERDFELCETVELAGNSHEKLTRSRYRRK